jgi:hypothetical protein
MRVCEMACSSLAKIPSAINTHGLAALAEPQHRMGHIRLLQRRDLLNSQLHLQRRHSIRKMVRFRRAHGDVVTGLLSTQASASVPRGIPRLSATSPSRSTAPSEIISSSRIRLGAVQSALPNHPQNFLR